ncbi:MAG TPA: hypothetical protein VH438_01040 [Gemmatimonadales bacterium]|jgi:hypothetical protein
MSASRLNAGRLFALSILMLGLLIAGNACTNPEGESSHTSDCDYNSSNHTCS